MQNFSQRHFQKLLSFRECIVQKCNMKPHCLASMVLQFPTMLTIDYILFVTVAPFGISTLSSSDNIRDIPIDFSLGNILVWAFFWGNVFKPTPRGPVVSNGAAGSSSSSPPVSATAFCHSSFSSACWRRPLLDRNLGSTARWDWRW